jgi:tetratricopeptide (TPR) repeat protein
MASGLSSLTFLEKWKLDRAVSFSATKYRTEREFHGAVRDAIALLEVKVKRENPNEWVFWFSLSDWYSTVGERAKAVQAAEKCVELRPNDPRSIYALAVELRMLTHAMHLGNAKIEGIKLGGYGTVDPQRSQQALEELGLALDEAAERALDLYEKVNELGVNDADKRLVYDTLASMYTSFPGLEGKVRPSPKLSTKPLSNPDEIAYEIYTNLRSQTDVLSKMKSDPSGYKAKVIELIRLCQLAIQSQLGKGDAFLSLANGYYFAAEMSQGQSRAGAYQYSLSRGYSVVFEWAFRKIETDNQNYGDGLLKGIKEQLASTGMTVAQIHQHMHEQRSKYFTSAISPTSLRILGGVL